MKKKKEQKLTSVRHVVSKTESSASRGWGQYLILLPILAISFLVYLPALQNGFVWDDDLYIQSNPLIQSLNLKAIFTENVAGNYHPLTMLVLAVEYQLFGLKETGYHFVNLLFHILNVALVFYAILLVGGKKEIAFAVALLFGVHPLHVESVAWAAELKDLLYTFFFLASYIFYLRYLQFQHKKFYAIAVALFLLSLLSKAMAASLPVVLLLTDYFKGRKINVAVVMEKVPFFLLAFIFGGIAVSAQQTAGATDMVSLPFYQRIIFACYGFVTYLIKLFLPINLSAYYPYPIKSGESIPAVYYVYVFGFLLLIAFSFYSLRITRKVVFGLGFFAITVFLVLQLLPVGGAVMADRYSYIPSIGILYLAAEGLYKLWSKNIKWAAVTLLVLFAVFFSTATYARCAVWKDGISLWSDVISKYQNVAIAYCNRGINLAKQEKYNEALSDFNNAIILKPDYSKAYSNRGLIFKIQNDYEKALDDFNKAVSLNPELVSALYNRAQVLKSFKRYDEAEKDLNRVITMKPDYADAYNSRGIVYFNLSKPEEAIADYRKAIELQSEYADAYANLGNVYSQEKNYVQAAECYNKAIAINPLFSEVYFNRGLAYFYSGNKSAACADLQKSAGLGHVTAQQAFAQICQ